MTAMFLMRLKLKGFCKEVRGLSQRILQTTVQLVADVRDISQRLENRGCAKYIKPFKNQSLDPVNV